MRVGIEVGGTFTDLVALSDSEIITAKVPSTPTNPDEGAINAIKAAGIRTSDITELLHGSTVATNAILERKGAKICLFVSKGIKDILFLQRHTRDKIYDIHFQKPKHVVDTKDTYEINERISFQGNIINKLNDTEVLKELENIFSQKKYEAAAICFLHSYVNPLNEKKLANLIKQVNPNLPVSCSSDVVREFREYERASTVAMSAYVQPVISKYINNFLDNLSKDKFKGRFSLMQSNGGLIPAKAMKQNSIAALFSGPAAGVVGAARSVQSTGYQNLITLDMGGTSTDVSVVDNGVLQLSSMTKIDSLPIKTPVVDISTVGAGGGSISWMDDGGLLRVGPQSAGAKPGPACYGKGGTFPTITDAHLIRGTIRAEAFLGGKMPLDPKASIKVYKPLADKLNLNIQDIADSSIKLAEANIVRAIQKISTELGKDPRDYVLVGFGGAGPLHAARVAEDLDIQTVIIPADAGVLSAYGLLLSDHICYKTRTNKLLINDKNIFDVLDTINELEIESVSYLNEVGIQDAVISQKVLEMRYVGQAFEISVNLDNISTKKIDKKILIEQFNIQHKREFNFLKKKGTPIEVISFRVGAKASPKRMNFYNAKTKSKTKIEKNIEISENGKKYSITILNRFSLKGKKYNTPLLIEDESATVFVPPGWTSIVDKNYNIILKR